MYIYVYLFSTYSRFLVIKFVIRERLSAHPVSFLACVCNNSHFVLYTILCVLQYASLLNWYKYFALFSSRYWQDILLFVDAEKLCRSYKRTRAHGGMRHTGTRKGFPARRSATIPLWAPYVNGVYTWDWTGASLGRALGTDHLRHGRYWCEQNKSNTGIGRVT